MRRLGDFRRDRPPTCPPRRTSSLNLSSTGQTKTCLNAPFSRYRAPRCQGCRCGFLVLSGRSSRCTNPSCNATPPVRHSRRAGVILIRQARPGSFLACTQYPSDHPCPNTQHFPRRT